MSDTENDVIQVRNLSIGTRRKGLAIPIVHDLSFTLGAGEHLGIVGESGSGKSMVLKAIADTLPANVEVLSGEILLQGENMLAMPKNRRRSLLGRHIAMIFQEPMTALNPTMKVVDQIAEGPMLHLGMGKAEARAFALDLMRKTGIPDVERRAEAYPRQLSGGLRQRIMIAIALACSPKVVLCDEPTTALDVTVQDQVLRLLEELCEKLNASIVFVTHDLSVIGQTCKRVAVMYSGEILEMGTMEDVFISASHPYTRALIESAPQFLHPDRPLIPIPGTVSNPGRQRDRCLFAARCAFRQDDCVTHHLPLIALGERHLSACIHTELLLQDESTNEELAEGVDVQ